MPIFAEGINANWLRRGAQSWHGARQMLNASEPDDPQRILEVAAKLPPDDRRPDVQRVLASFGRNFRKARIAAKMSQADVERLTGIPQHYISTMERGRENPTLETMARLAKALGKPPADLLQP